MPGDRACSTIITPSQVGGVMFHPFMSACEQDNSTDYECIFVTYGEYVDCGPENS